MRIATMIRLAASLVLLCAGPGISQSREKVPEGSKVFINQMEGFEVYLKKAFEEKKVPLTIVEDKALADYEITGTSNSQKAGTMKKLMGNWHSREEASVNLTNLKTGETVFAYSVHKEASAHGKKSTAEACAKHFKDQIAKSK